MRKWMLVSLAAALVGCGGSGEGVKEDPQPVEEVVETPEEPEEIEAPVEAEEPEDMKALLEAAANGEHRSPENIARNEYRHPVETLSFFEIEPDMTVVELWPGGGWYTEVLAPALSQGKLVAAHFSPKTDQPDHYTNGLYNAFSERAESDPAFANVVMGMLHPGEKVEVGEPESADLVVTFRNIHSFMGEEILDEIFEESYKVLKPGGVFGVVEHRAAEDADVDEAAESGYVPTAYVIERAEAAGFELVDQSEVNANPRDTKDYEGGVWALPPSFRHGDTDREKYEEIGESDRMTLKFQKAVDSGADEADEAEETDED